MTMSTLTRENGVLKLVRPGGMVEIHKNPITAAEVMRRNPRHCVTRPDVFKFPWIVVRPESVLCLGRVFFIVPYHTIHRLLQRSTRKHSTILQQQMSLKQNHDCGEQSQLFSCNELNLNKYTCELSTQPTCFHGFVKKQTPRTSQKTINPRHGEDSEGHHHPKFPVGCGFPARTPIYQYYDQLFKKQSLIKLSAQVKSQPVDDGSLKKQYPVECWPTMMAGCKNQLKELKPQTPSGGSFVEERVPFDSKRNDFNQGQGCVTVPQNDDRLELKCSQQVPKLNPCLKKHKTNLPKSRGLRVTFAFPADKEN